MADLSNLAVSDYSRRINRVVDHIQQNLTSRFTLDQLAEIACFSPYHFHRIFTNAVGETLNSFVVRVRLERALYLLSHHPTLQIQEVAKACGFTSHSDFTRSFRSRFGIAPRRFNVPEYRELQRTKLQDSVGGIEEGKQLAKLPTGDNPDGFSVSFHECPQRNVAYIRAWRPFEGVGVVTAATTLISWARERGLETGQWLGYMWEDPDVTDLDQCRYDVGVTVLPSVKEDEVVSVVSLAPMKVASVEVSGPIDVEQHALDWLYSTWLPSSGFVPDHQPCFEAWKGLPFDHGMTYFELDVEFPVVRV